ncbi:hypothetical protein H5410_061492 [Solanum commersonii]|uniref:DUF1985 domain-containing protein n=1 Tax=Solanum commersonii TaxID=4109 RepID=A0A9J5W9U2_SOLCO|nr:hypothetical protein H5410_061492 [Solanum commersonii]
MAKVHKTRQKRGKKFTPAISRPSLPKSLKYVVKQISTHSLKFGQTYNMYFVKDLNLSMGVEGIALFKNSIFGSYLNIHTCNYQEFAIITGLKCTGNPDDFKYPDSTGSRLNQRYFLDLLNSMVDINIFLGTTCIFQVNEIIEARENQSKLDASFRWHALCSKCADK